MTLIELALTYQGKAFKEGWQDCMTTASNLYTEYAGLAIRDYARPSLWYMHPQFDFVDQFCTQEGFVQVTSNPNAARVGDLIVMSLGRTTVANHMGVYVGGNKILHHLTGLKSVVEEYTPRWRSRVMGIYRHPQVTKKIEGSQVNVVEHLPYGLRVKLNGQNDD